jgi:hypothetical protein
MVQYDPPEHLSPAEAGTLIDNAADMRDITATMVDLAVRGFIKIEEREDSKLFGLIKNQDFYLHRLKEGTEEAKLASMNDRVLNGIFRIPRQHRGRLTISRTSFTPSCPGSGTASSTSFSATATTAPGPTRWRQPGPGGHWRWLPDRVRGQRHLLLAFDDAGAVHRGGGALNHHPDVVRRDHAGPHRSRRPRALEKVKGFEEFLRRVESPAVRARAEDA